MITGNLDPISNREDWSETVYVFDTDGAEAVDLTDAEIVVAVKDRERQCIVLSGSISDGTIALVGDGTFSWLFTADRVRELRAGAYDVGCTMKIGSSTKQLLIGAIAVLDGVVA